MMAQYLEIKSANPDCLLFYRMGDFYELFFEDAEIASRTLGIVLTKRGKHQGEDIPMCGVPVDRADDYLQRLIGAGHRVAVCEQIEDPAEAAQARRKSVVKRAVVRLVTPGTITEETLLDPGRANPAGRWPARARRPTTNGATGSPRSTSRRRLQRRRKRRGGAAGGDRRASSRARSLRARQRCSTSRPEDALWRETRAAADPDAARDGFDAERGERRLCGFFGVGTLAGFGAFTRAEFAAAAAIVAYVERTQFGARPPLRRPRAAQPARRCRSTPPRAPISN